MHHCTYSLGWCRLCEAARCPAVHTIRPNGPHRMQALCRIPRSIRTAAEAAVVAVVVELRAEQRPQRAQSAACTTDACTASSSVWSICAAPPVRGNLLRRGQAAVGRVGRSAAYGAASSTLAAEPLVQAAQVEAVAAGQGHGRAGAEAARWSKAWRSGAAACVCPSSRSSCG